MTKAISVSGLHKRFGRTPALDGLDLEVESGEVHGFLGPNGAGKSTTIRVLLGLLRGDSGAAQVLGRDPWRDAVEVHRRIAYVPGDVTLWRGLTGGEVIDLYGRLRGGLDAGRRAELVERFDLDPTRKGRTYSKGNRQKVALVAAFASDVDLLILDEPTSGLDPLMEAVFRRCVAEERERGRTVLLSSHVLGEVEELCDRVSIVRKGRTVERGSLAELRHLTRTGVSAELATVPEGLAALPGVHGLDVRGDRVRFQVDTDKLGAVLRVLGEAGVRSLTSAPPTLEELFLRHYRDDGPGGGPDGGGGTGGGLDRDGGGTGGRDDSDGLVDGPVAR
ncbi:ABC transporter ATP-binding protein [Streptomyces tagetis]|uniref:ABC transporter ATP-binding protein n=1 Tax=Streptomyces tagetis TaxID=2820809 RepID=A0A940XME8_9ACTN|nr:ABC transporter ATP-binding protein [Streptomyces sp. RG38]MBQ0827435.1 ABC transporter ATP-binding protein [Streptomyces sp. RG38]